MSSRDAVINLRGTNSFSSVAQAAARDTQNLINVFRGFNAEGKAVTTNMATMGQNITVFNSQGRALQSTLGGISPAFRTFGADVTTSSNALRQLTPGLQQTGQAADQAGQGIGRAAGFMRQFRGVIFGGTGLLTSGIEAVGMLQNLEMSADRVSEAQDNLNRIIAEGGAGSREHTNALRELANANRAYNFQQRITFLSISDMIPFTLNLTNSLSNMGIGFNTVREAAAKFTKALSGLSMAMKGVLIGTGIGIALTAAILLFEHFSQKSETVVSSINEIQKASDQLNKDLETDVQSVEQLLDRMQRSTSINAALIRQNLIDMIPAKEDTEMDLWEQFLNLFEQKSNQIEQRPRPSRGGGVPGGPQIESITKTEQALKGMANAAVEVIATTESMDQSMIPLTANMFELGAEGEALAATFGITGKMTDEQAIKFLGLVNAMIKLDTPTGRSSAQFRQLQIEMGLLRQEVNGVIPDIGSLSLEVETLNAASLGLTTSFAAGTQKFLEWFDAESKAADSTAAFSVEADRQLKAINPLIDATKLTVEQKMELIKIDLAHGDVLGAYNKMLEDNAEKTRKNVVEIEGWSEAVTNHMNAMDSMSQVILTTAQAAGQAINEFNRWDEGIKNSILVSNELHPRLVKLATDLGIDLPAGIQLTNDQLKQLIQAYRETGSEAGVMADIHAEVFSELHQIMDEVVQAAKEGGKEFSESWKEIKDAIPKGERSFFKNFVEDLGELDEANDTLQQTTSALDTLLDVTHGFIDEESAENWSDKLVKGIKDVAEEADELPGTAFNIDTLAASAIQMAKSADSGPEFRVLINFLNDLHGAVESRDANKIEQLRIQIGLLSGSLEGLSNVISDKGAATFAAEIETILNPFKDTDIPETITMPSPVEPEGVDAILDKYRGKIQTLGSSGGGIGGGGSDSAEVEKVGGEIGKTSIFDPVVMPAPDFEAEFSPGLQAGIDLVAEFNIGVQEQLSAMWEAGTEIIGDFVSTIQEDFSALHEAGIEIMADFNSSVQEEISAMYEFSTEVTEDMISTMQDSFDSLDTSDAVDAIEELEDAIDNLKSKTVTVTVKVKREGGSGGGGKSGGGGAGRQHGGLDFVTKPTDFTMGEHYLPEIVQVVKAGGRSLYDDIGGDVNRLINKARQGGGIRGEVQAIRSEYMARLQNMISRIVRDITSRAVHVTVMTPDRKTLADEMIYNAFDNIGSYRGR